MSISLYIITVFFCLFSKVCVTKEDDLNNFINSFIELKNRLIHFFRLTDVIEKIKKGSDSLQKRKREIKKAYKTFINEAFDNDAVSKLNDKTHDITMFMKQVEEPVGKGKHLSAPQLIKLHGYRAEAHYVHTRDGYVIEIHKVTSFSETAKGSKKMALLLHGIMGCSEDWLLLGPKKALPYLLSEAGYDVWLTNVRGSMYSQFNVNAYTSSFWDFSFHEMGVYDLPAIIDYILIMSENNTEINFVGHSMGGTVFLVLLSTLPQYNKVMKSATLLAPLAFMLKVKGPLKILAELYTESIRNPEFFLVNREFVPVKYFPQRFIEKACRSALKSCFNPLLFLADGGKADPDYQKILSEHVPANISAKTMRHYLQLATSGQFQMYDYRTPGNIIRHKNLHASLYNLSQITVPIVIFNSHSDWLCTPPNILTLLKSLPKVATNHTIQKYDFSHTDFIWGEEAPKLVFRPIIENLESNIFSGI